MSRSLSAAATRSTVVSFLGGAGSAEGGVDGCTIFESRSVVTVSVTVVVPKSASVRRMVPEIGTCGSGASGVIGVVIVISVKEESTARWREKWKGSRMRLPLELLPTTSWDVKVWELGGEELVGVAPGSMDGSCVAIRLDIVEGEVWTRAVHDFVSSVAEEGRVAMVQKREVEGRGIVQGVEMVDKGGGGRRRRRWLGVIGERERERESAESDKGGR